MKKVKAGRAGRLLAIVAVAAVLTSCDPGWISALAGTGTSGQTTVPTASADAQFESPRSVVMTPSGGFYVWDSAACAIYWETSGQVSVYAGIPGTCGDAGDGGSATSALLSSGLPQNFVESLALGADGTLYFGQTDSSGAGRIRAISTAGVISTVAGTSVPFLQDLTSAPDGSVFYSWSAAGDSGVTIDRLESDGTSSVVYVTANWAGNVVAASANELVFRLSPDAFSDGPIGRFDLTTQSFTSTGFTTSSGYGSNLPTTVASDGTIYTVSGTATPPSTIVRIDPDNTVTTIAGNGTVDPGTRALSGTGTGLPITPQGMTLDASGNLVFTSGHAVYSLLNAAQASVPTTTIPATTLPNT